MLPKWRPSGLTGWVIRTAASCQNCNYV